MMHRLHSWSAALGVAALLLVPAAASAQTAPGPMASPTAPAAGTSPRDHRFHKRGIRYMRALRSLNLTDAQRRQIRTIVRTQAEATRTQIDGVLTPEQRTQLRASMQRPAGM